jgi:peptide/nickel transport system substrate-binding protein
MRSIARAPIVVLGLLFLAADFGQTASQNPAVGHPLSAPLVAQCDPGQPGGRLTLVITNSPLTFNPVLVMDNSSDAVVRMISGTLVNLDAVTQEPKPGLAESWSVAPDQKAWTFKLRPGLRWSDGETLTAADVVFTWNEVMYNPDLNRFMYDLFRIGGKNFAVSQVDELTVRVVTPEVFAPFAEFFGSVAILPKHTLARDVKEGRFFTVYGPDARPEKILSCGPYRVKQSRPGKFVLLERNPEYWVVDKQGRRLPYFDEVMFTVADGPAAAARLFLDRKSDAADAVRPEDYDSFKQAAAGGRLRLVELGADAGCELLCFNQNPGADAAGRPLVSPAKLKWFRNKKFRQAVSCALNRDRLAREVYGGRAQPISSFVSPENKKWNNPDVPHYTYDPARARALFAEAGLLDRNHDGILRGADGTPVEIMLTSNAGNPRREHCAQVMADDLWKLGVKVNLQFVDFRALVEKLNGTFDYECVLMGLGGGGVDPASQMNVLKSGDLLHQWFPRQKTPATDWEARIDALMDDQMRTLDFPRRKKDYDEVQAILAEELPMIYAVTPAACAAIRTGLGNTRPSGLTPYHMTWNIEELYFSKP